ncbi:Exopolyphosphatase [Mortierella alpina]|uniref:Exopolyphosphatase n=1 Tax=Mortierella alpina TaxID=64518 RepID=A0A9P6JEG8_MORAP|nr:Exopolyphosphatase [Mortierella alpina]
MDTFLASIKPRLKAEPSAPVILVSGNESADLDSIVSAVTTSYFLSRLQQSVLGQSNAIVIPFVNIDRQDLALRSDVDYLLSSSNIKTDDIFFRDQLPQLESILMRNPDQLSLFLVDHNRLAIGMSSLSAAKVVGTIDHHVDEGLHMDTAKIRRIETVGSCASLVADLFLNDTIALDQKDTSGKGKGKGQPDWLRQSARLLLGPILIDTRNLNPEFKKVTPLDIKIAKQLMPYTGDSNCFTSLFTTIDEARQDTSKLSFYDLLRKDYKEWSVNQTIQGESVLFGISSVNGVIDDFVKRDGKEVIQQAMSKWASKRGVQLLMVLFGHDFGAENGGYQRQIIVDPHSKGLQGFSAQLESVTELKLKRTTVVDTDDFVKRGGKAYKQQDTSFSRKQIAPIVEKLLGSSDSKKSNM